MHGAWGAVAEATEVCDTIDQDCDSTLLDAPGADDDDDGVLDYTCGGTDCNDLNDDVYPGAAEDQCDNVDNDCDDEIIDAPGAEASVMPVMCELPASARAQRGSPSPLTDSTRRRSMSQKQLFVVIDVVIAEAVAPFDPDEAERILASERFEDRDGDTVLERDGRPRERCAAPAAPFAMPRDARAGGGGRRPPPPPYPTPLLQLPDLS